jgi:5-formyltetrahydrofolate cyclo-ligase
LASIEEPAQSKAEIRAAALARRDALTPAEHLDYGRAILYRILAMKEFREAQTVLAYCGFGSEIDTAPLLRAVLEGGKTLLLPRVNRAAGTLDIYQVKNLVTDLRPGVWGILEPNPDLCASWALADIGLVIVPGAAFDRRGGRIGYGKGHYDKLLGACHRVGNYPPLIAGAFEVQVVNAIPMEPHDVPVDTLVTESRTWSAGS